jgi:hypothetical protein
LGRTHATILICDTSCGTRGHSSGTITTLPGGGFPRHTTPMFNALGWCWGLRPHHGTRHDLRAFDGSRTGHNDPLRSDSQCLARPNCHRHDIVFGVLTSGANRGVFPS